MLEAPFSSTSTALEPLPILADYDVTEQHGFAPFPKPLDRLSHPYYAPWEDLMDQLKTLLETKALRGKVAELPVLSIDRLLDSKPETRRAYVVLSGLAHSYVWGSGKDDVSEILPESLAVPWQAICHHLRIQPIQTYSASNLWNWTFKNPGSKSESDLYALENLIATVNYTSTSDESWFYMVAVAIEMTGGPILVSLLSATQAIREQRQKVVIQELEKALEGLKKIAKLLPRMFEHCDPGIFYWQLRPFINGWANGTEVGLPFGLKYKGLDPVSKKQDVYHQLLGVSAAQSSLFPALDILLGVQHFETGDSSSSEKMKKSSSRNSLLKTMEEYMPGNHRDFLDRLRKVANIRDYVVQNTTTTTAGQQQQQQPEREQLIRVYDACVQEIVQFRNIHIQVVTRYIVAQARRGPPSAVATINERVEKEEGEEEAKSSEGIKGTGGSDLAKFLKQTRDETKASKLQPPLL